MNMEEITNKLNGVMESYNNDLNSINGKKQELKSKLDSGKISKNFYDEKVEGLQQDKLQKQSEYSNKLDKVYNSAKDKIKSRVSYGEGDPATTSSYINQAENLDKTELEIIVDKFKAEDNYLGLKGIKETANDKGVRFDFRPVQKELADLDFHYKGKNKRLTKENPANDLDRMRKVADRL